MKSFEQRANMLQDVMAMKTYVINKNLIYHITLHIFGGTGASFV